MGLKQGWVGSCVVYHLGMEENIGGASTCLGMCYSCLRGVSLLLDDETGMKSD